MFHKLFVRFFAAALIATATVMLYTSLNSEIEVLEEGQMISSKSRYAEKIVRAPVRRVRQAGREFRQVKAPGGSWYECRNDDCAETLRLEYVDKAFSHLYAPEISPSPYQSHDR